MGAVFLHPRRAALSQSVRRPSDALPRRHPKQALNNFSSVSAHRLKEFLLVRHFMKVERGILRRNERFQLPPSQNCSPERLHDRPIRQHLRTAQIKMAANNQLRAICPWVRLLWRCAPTSSGPCYNGLARKGLPQIAQVPRLRLITDLLRILVCVGMHKAEFRSVLK